MPGLSPAEATALADEFEAGFRSSIISFWYPRAIDGDGGYRVGWDRRGRPAGDPRGIVSQARLVYVFARAARAGHRPDIMLDAAVHGYRYLRDVLWDTEHGGFVWMVDEPKKVTYGNAFGVFALAELARAGGPDEARNLAVQTIDKLQAHAHDDVDGGYREVFEPDWSLVPLARSPVDNGSARDKLLNTNLHVLEAMVAAHRAELDARATACAAELVEVLSHRAAHRRYRAPMTDSYTDHWRPRPLDRSVRFGQIVELAWMLVDAAEAIGGDVETARAVSDRLIRYTQQRGTDPESGGVWRSGWLGRPARNRTYESWAQAEALLAYGWRVTEGTDDDAADRLRATWRFIQQHVVDHAVGEWHDVVDRALVGRGPKGNAWKAGYHATRALLDGADLLRQYAVGPPAGTGADPVDDTATE
jgi:mannose/cellobiose epimerase-like protein (N-acyl-D-glucosamine 2-epimerase family)